MPVMMYNCDYCNKQFRDTPVALKRHLEGVSHERSKALWYDSLRYDTQIDDPQFFTKKGICNHFIRTARALEQEAHPAIDKLTSKMRTLNLERVRHMKSRLVAITDRVQNVRDELHHLLDDDHDITEMYLSDKLRQQLDNSYMTSAK